MPLLVVFLLLREFCLDFLKSGIRRIFFSGRLAAAASGPGKMRGASATMMSARAVPVHPQEASWRFSVSPPQNTILPSAGQLT